MPPKIPLSLIIKEHYPLFLTIPAVYFGKLYDRVERRRFTRFRDKSALYGGRVKPGDPPSWDV